MGVPYAEVIGDPIAHSKSPLIHNFWLEKLGIEGDYRATQVRRGELAEYVESRREDPDWRGCNVTMPHKQDVGALLDRIDPSAEWAGSVNCVYWDGAELWGCNTDTSGIAAAVDERLIRRNSVAVIGSGAAARTALWVLAMEEPGELRAVARDIDRAEAIFDALRTSGRCFGMSKASEAFSGTTVIINTTPLGMAGFAAMPPNVVEAIRDSRIDAAILDMVYHPVETDLLAAAKLYGRRCIDGLVMLTGQAQDSFGHFFPASPPASSWEDSELRALLSR